METTPRTIVYNAIDNERAVQDNKWGTIQEHPQELSGWMLIMRKELEEAEEAWVKGDIDHCLLELLQVVATGVAAMEQYEPITREQYGERCGK